MNSAVIKYATLMTLSAASAQTYLKACLVVASTKVIPGLETCKMKETTRQSTKMLLAQKVEFLHIQKQIIPLAHQVVRATLTI